MSIWNNFLLAPSGATSGTLNTLIPFEAAPDVSETPKIVAANAIKLPASASAVDHYYEDFMLEITRVNTDQTKHVQKKVIRAYDGTTKIAVIDDVWDTGYEPKIGDAFKIYLAYPDARVSINPVPQIMDYITSPSYGRGLSYKDNLKLPTWLNSARQCDAKSNVSLKLTTTQSISKDAVYKLESAGGILLWEGVVSKDYINSLYIDFTDVLGKITNRWNSWKTFPTGSIIYTEDNFYRVTVGGVFATKPTHTSGTTNNLEFISSLEIEKVSGTGPETLSLDITSNPVLALNAAGEEISGYSLYDSDSIDYWRLVGWDSHSQSSATLYQTNFTIDTSAPLFDNINMMLEHCNGIFSYSAGKYELNIERAEDDIIIITEDDIIGKIAISDSGNSSAYNSVVVSYQDPGNNFEGRNISLFSATYLKQDRNVPKKGNITVSGITNYYNVRILADSYLKKSRQNMTIQLTLFPEFLELVPGSVIGIQYPKYKWVSKLFRVDTITIEVDGSITISAKEYSSNFYSLTNLNKTTSVSLYGSKKKTPLPAPTNLKATYSSNEIKQGILLNWDNVLNMSGNILTEIYVSDIPDPVLDVDNITSDIITFNVAHGLIVGSMISPSATVNELQEGTKYFVKEVVSPTAVKISSSLGGPILDLTDLPTTTLYFNAFVLLATVVYPENSYFHVVPGLTDTTTKYYRIRYRIEL